MITRHGVRFVFASITAVFIMSLSYSLALASLLDLKLDPSEIHIREFFQGAPMTITATAPPKSLYVIEIKGESHALELLRKGRRGGLWMNVGQVKVQIGAVNVFDADQRNRQSAGKGHWAGFWLRSLEEDS